MAVAIYTRGGDAYDCAKLNWKSNKQMKEVKNYDFQRTVFRAQAPEVTGRTDNNDLQKIGISVSSANKWLRMDEDAFENYLRNNTPYLEQYRAFILSFLKICPQTPATNIM